MYKEIIQMYDPKREYIQNKEDIDNSIHNVLNHGLFINGPEVKELEKKLSEYTGVKHCISVSNGTDAIQVALMALDVGIDDEVITVAHTWISTAEVVSLVNAKPIFIDINEHDFNMNPELIREKITNKTKAILVVSLYGLITDMDKINEIAKEYNLPVIEDGAQSFGATYKGRKSCSLTTIGTTSFFPSKPLGCYGDGGACFTNDDELAIKMRSIKSHGGIKRFHHKYIGMNARLDTIHASILLTKLKYFDNTIENRNNCANYYNENLKFLEEYGLKLPKVEEDKKSVWAQYSILATNKNQRDDIVSYLKKNNVNVAIFYPAPLHTQECFSYLLEDHKPHIPVTEKVCNQIFNLPCYGEFTKEEQDYIINLLLKYFQNK